MERLNNLIERESSLRSPVWALARALVMGGGARAERDALARAVEGLSFRFAVADGECRLRIDPADEPHWGLAVDLLAIAAVPGFQLRRCFNDGTWFSPALRSARSKFCSQRCRNRFNYEMREQQARFVCVECGQIRDIDGFSGLALEDEVVQPADVHALEPLCVPCIVSHHPEWTAYVSTAELIAPESSTTLPAATAEYAGSIHRLIHEALESAKEPQSIKMIADYVAARMRIRGRRPELTILGHLLRFPARYKQLSKNVFALSDARADAATRKEVEA